VMTPVNYVPLVQESLKGGRKSPEATVERVLSAERI
jgi:hypothetical protein